MPTLEDAIKLAVEAHSGQSDPQLPDEPYILHPLRVMQRLRDAGRSVEVQAVAVLHDVFERGGMTPDQLLELGWHPTIVAAVQSVTHDPDETLEQAAARAAADPIGCEVRLADVYDRLRPERLAQLSEADAANERLRLEGVRHLLTRADVVVP